MNTSIPFQQLLTAVQNLTPNQKDILRRELEQEHPNSKDKSRIVDILLNGPVYDEEHIKIIEQNRKSISEWRTKN